MSETAFDLHLRTLAHAHLRQPAALNSGPFRHLTRDEALDKAKGALLGLAVGEAIGAMPDGKARTAAVGMALALAECLMTTERFDALDFSRRLALWYRAGYYTLQGRCTGIDATTKAALDGFLRTGRTGQAPTDPQSAGDAALARVAPAVIFARLSFPDAWLLACAQCVVTHGAQAAISATQFFAGKLWDAVNGATKRQMLEARPLPVADRVLLINAGEYRTKPPARIGSTGDAVDTLEAALWAVWSTESFEAALLTAVDLGGSVTAAVGQIAGALYGVEAIPDRWLARLAWRERVEAVAATLFEMAPKR